MNLNNKIKIMWCDRNVHTAHFEDLLINFDYIEIESFDNPDDAISAFREDPNYQLIISGNLFAGMDGLQFYEALQLTGATPQFLLFTSDELENIDSYQLLNNFKYFRKAIYSPEAFEQMLEELIHKSFDREDAHLKLQTLRKSLGLSVGQFAGLLKVSNDVVEKHEQNKDVPASYVVSVCRHFNIPLNFFSTVDLDYFSTKLKENSNLRVKGII